MDPIQVPVNGGKQVNILGIPMLIRIHGRDTGGVVSVVELPLTHSPDLVCEIVEDVLDPWMDDWAHVITRRQDVRPAYRRDGTVYAFWRRTVSENRNIYGHIVKPLIIPADESCELDTPEQWAEVERRWRIKMNGEAI